MLEGSCHCGACRWTLAGEPGPATSCNCTLCRRYGALWAYDYENQRIRLEGPASAYARADKQEPPHLEILFCPGCGGMLAWRGLILDDRGRRRMAVNLRMAEPEAVAAIPVKRLDGLLSWSEVGSEGRCVGDLWF